MNDRALFDATVPVFRHYLARIDNLLELVSQDPASGLHDRLAPHAFTAVEHLDTAIGFVSRTICPLLGQDLMDDGNRCSDRQSLVSSGRQVAQWLTELDPIDFTGASKRVIRHTAGEAELEQDASTFVTLFALPNFYFHFGMAFAILRLGGATIGKAEFDGLHRYVPGFHFRG